MYFFPFKIEGNTVQKPDLLDQATENLEEEWFTDGSSFVRYRVRRGGQAIVGTRGIREAKPLPPNKLSPKD